MADKRTDGWSASFTDFDSFAEDVRETERNSRWHTDIASDAIRLEAIFPIEAMECASVYGIDPDVLIETASPYGTQLVIDIDGRKLPVRDTAIQSLQETAKLSGTALSRMTPSAYSEVLNAGFKVARGNSLVLERYEKLSACHSGAESGYEIMSASELIDATVSVSAARFGETRFIRGNSSHSFTDAWWELPQAQNHLIHTYQKALEEAGAESEYAVNFMPALHFYTSDTANSCAVLAPVFMMDGSRAIQLTEGIRVKHTRKAAENGLYGTALYKELVQGIYARFEASAETIRNLAKRTVFNPENCVISLCRRYGIPKRYGEAAREEVARYTAGNGTINAHDLYLGMTAVTQAAADCGASMSVRFNLDEALGKIAVLQDWSEHDVGGTVSWKD